uniref:Magnesium-dependent phosphatase-1 n=1 Tax=Hemiselmis tepida TaxID=464990 RepID=A0A6T6SH26_9CRYP|mmetsp:Transcript_17426/g.43865  ORF Transcript_17426/g.43865 Transcript_17426/m.43865 type:complete len:227 (+) Transcript_17426:31-711(+)
MTQSLTGFILVFLASSPAVFGFVPAGTGTSTGSAVRNTQALRSASTALQAQRMAYPRVVAFDLDATLWIPEMYQLWGGGAPFKKNSDGSLTDCKGTRCTMMGNSAEILHELNTDPKWKDSKVAYCSCTDEPSWAAECMKLFEVGGGITMEKAAPIKQIFKANKTEHFKRIHKDTGIPYEQMIFFDNEEHNCRSVKQLGVTCIYTPRGMTPAEWSRGLKEYASSQKK